MNNLNKTTLPIYTILVFLAGFSQQADATLLDLRHEPLFLDQSVPPAIAVTLDDSGSMYWSYMGDSGSTGTDFTDPVKNTLYFDPAITYAPPLKADGTQMPNSNPTAAWVDGYPNNMNDTVDLTDDYIAIRRIIYNRYDNNVRISFVSTQEKSISNQNSTYQNYHPNWSGSRAYYSVPNTSGGYSSVYLYGTDLQNFANWYSYYNSRAKLSRAAISRAFSGFGPNFKIAWQELNRNTSFTNLTKFETTHRSDFFDWLFKSPTDGGTPLRNAFKRAGELFEKNSSYWSSDFNANLSCQQNFHIAISDGGWNGNYYGSNIQDESASNIPGDTENRYTNYTGTGEQIIYSKSEDGSTLSDIAFDSWANDLNPGLSNNVKRFKKDYKNSEGNAIDFTGLTDSWQSPEFVWNPKNDPAYWQHVVTFNVGMGLEASRIRDYEKGTGSCPQITAITDPKEAVYKSLRNGDCAWPNADNENTTKIDDVWHSSINSRGQFFSANNPEQLVQSLNTVVNSILERLARGSSSTVSSGVVTDDTSAYTPGFDSSTWSGSLISRQVLTDGTFSEDVNWDASCVLTGGICPITGEYVAKQSIRNIYTYDPVTKQKQLFDTSLTGNLRNVFNLNAENQLTKLGVTSNDFINYIIGDQSKEQSRTGTLKDRTSILADIVHSSPYIVRGPGAAYDDNYWPRDSVEYNAFDNGNGYIDFQLRELNRNNTVFIGSNGGMLHAFDADSTETQERWAYMPYKAFENINKLPDPTAPHWSFVDNTPVSKDAFINNNWHTVLISGMRYGGQAFFALDITDGSATEPNVMWEFTDQNDADMGFSYGQASIVRLSGSGEWVALIPNGYNNTQKDYDNLADPRNRISSTGHAVLFVVRLSDGQLIRKLDTGVGTVNTPNGLASAIAVDSEFASTTPVIDQGADFAYAGDLYGNLWRFDLSDKDSSNWDIKRVIAADGIMQRPITIQPKVIAVPKALNSRADDVIVMFGTGKYLEPADRSKNLPAKQYMVGVVDGLGSSDLDLSITDSKFVEQSFTLTNGGNFRQLTNLPVNLINNYGWKVELIEQGERVFNPTALFGSQILLATSNVTAGTDPCEPGGRSWLMAFNPYTGGLPSVGRIFKNIQVYINGTLTTLSGSGTGFLVQDFVIGSPPLVEDRTGTGSLVIEGTENTQVVSFQKFTWRRRNWTNLLTE